VVFLRVVAIVLALGVALSAAAWLFTGERRWLDRSLTLVKVAVVVGLVFFGVLAFERL
jgi:hypothetical protein